MCKNRLVFNNSNGTPCMGQTCKKHPTNPAQGHETKNKEHNKKKPVEILPSTMPKCLFLFKIIDLLFRLTNDIVVDILTFGRDWPKISNPVAETKKLFACLQHVFANN